MSRTTLCGITAAILIIGSLSSMIVRRQILGDAVKVPRGPGTWKVAMVVQGVSQGDAHLQTAAPLDFGRQHISDDAGGLAGERGELVDRARSEGGRPEAACGARPPNRRRGPGR